MTRVRFAPSPTGKLHLGSARTAIFNWLYARHTDGKFILRIEDTDLKRSDEKFTASILNDMKWLGMEHDELYRQSERFDIYAKYRDKLIAESKAYYCACDKDEVIKRNKARGITDEVNKYDGHCRGKTELPDSPYVVRLNIGENRDIIFKDMVRKSIRVNTKDLDDLVLWKRDNSPTYNFAVVIDDALMEITHILRGEDHITNTAKQCILYDHLNFNRPVWAHLPLVFGKDRAPLSKRKGSTNIEDYRALGILPVALINYIARLGWAHGNDEIFTIDELIKYFDINKLSRSNAVYDTEKMEWVNGKHLKMMPVEKLMPRFEEFLSEAGLEKTGKMKDSEWLSFAVNTLRERNNALLSLYNEMKAFADNDGEVSIEDKAQIKLDKLLSDENNKKAFTEAAAALTGAPDSDKLEEILRDIASKYKVKFGSLVGILRIKLTGKLVSPDIISVIKLLGKEVSSRLRL